MQHLKELIEKYKEIERGRPITTAGIITIMLSIRG